MAQAKRSSALRSTTSGPGAPGSITIVGASLAGIRAAAALRRAEFDGTITMIGDEPHKPYDRPPLSKELLSGKWGVDKLALLADDKLDALDIDWRLGVQARSLDVDNRSVSLDDGSAVDADAVVIATGARARTIPGADDIGGVTVLRTMDDAIEIRRRLDASPRRVVVIGAGFIGAEVAASARELGLAVTMVEMADVPMARGLGTEMGLVAAQMHRDRGVDLRLGTGVEQIVAGSDGHVAAVVLSDGSEIDADLVVVGVGVVPNTEWLEDSGLELDNGVVCDPTCMAAPGIAAAGDVARWYNRRFDEVMRVEHWDNAVEQGTYVAKRLLANEGDIEPYEPVPWFWSDQYDRKIQMAGRFRDGDTSEIVTGAVDELRFAVIYGRGDRLTGVLAFNRPRHLMQYRRLISEGATWSDALDFAHQSANPT